MSCQNSPSYGVKYIVFNEGSKMAGGRGGRPAKAQSAADALRNTPTSQNVNAVPGGPRRRSLTDVEESEGSEDPPRNSGARPNQPKNVGGVPNRPQNVGGVPNRPQNVNAVPNRPNNVGAVPNRPNNVLELSRTDPTMSRPVAQTMSRPPQTGPTTSKPPLII